MNKLEIIEIFTELLDRWRIAEETIIDNMGNLDYSYLEKELKEYQIRFQKALNS